MGLTDWLRAFRKLHEQAKSGALDGRELADYHAARDELARALLAAQHMALQPGQKPRRTLRVARALQADITFHDGTERAITRDVSAGGFSALLGRAPEVEAELTVSLRIPGGEPLQASARAVDSKQQVGNVLASFAFSKLSESQQERLEIFVFDAVLGQLQS